MIIREHEFLAAATRLYIERKERAPLSNTERALWNLALDPPHGGVIIMRQGAPYLMRVFLLPKVSEATDIPSVYLHYFVTSDDLEGDPHNHPWSAESHILTGGYFEHRLSDSKQLLFKHCYHPGQINSIQHCYHPGQINSIQQDTFHLIELLNPEQGCWTLLVSGGRSKPVDGTDWGFFNVETQKYTPWGERERD